MKLQFGTDGIRSKAGTFPLDPKTIEKIGFATARSNSKSAPLVILAHDTRESSNWIRQAFSKGLQDAGAIVWYAGTMPTAAVSCAICTQQADLGIMITASHNPWYDNGIKFFNSKGKKLSKAQQKQLLLAFENPQPAPQKGSEQLRLDLLKSWEDALPKPDLKGWTILLDCAHGAASHCAPKVLQKLGATVLKHGCNPDGKNINDDVGALHPPTDLKGADVGICLDGDADRIVLISSQGVLDGDDILWMLRKHFNGPLVGSVMSNGGLEDALQGRLLRSAVGDSNVEALMKEKDARLGAEPSGHVLFADGLPTGDGLYTALRLIAAVGLPLPTSGWTRWPISKQNIRYEGAKIDLHTINEINTAKEAGQRVIVRYSGTEPVLRILVEGMDSSYHLQKIKEAFLKRIK